MRSLKRLRNSFNAILSILALSAVSKVDLLRKAKSPGRLVEQLILEHDVSEVRLLLQQVKELIEGDLSGTLFYVKFLLNRSPLVIALHY